MLTDRSHPIVTWTSSGLVLCRSQHSSWACLTRRANGQHSGYFMIDLTWCPVEPAQSLLYCKLSSWVGSKCKVVIQNSGWACSSRCQSVIYGRFSQDGIRCTVWVQPVQPCCLSAVSRWAGSTRTVTFLSRNLGWVSSTRIRWACVWCVCGVSVCACACHVCVCVCACVYVCVCELKFVISTNSESKWAGLTTFLFQSWVESVTVNPFFFAHIRVETIQLQSVNVSKFGLRWVKSIRKCGCLIKSEWNHDILVAFLTFLTHPNHGTNPSLTSVGVIRGVISGWHVFCAFEVYKCHKNPRVSQVQVSQSFVGCHKVS